MSEDTNSTNTTSSCASCGIAEVDNVKLKECNDCDLVRYCSDECQREHKSEHEEACKKRAAELRGELLFKQPESTDRGDCPICCLPMPIGITKCTLFACCSKSICNGCDFANQVRESKVSQKQRCTCPFCRKPLPQTKDECDKLLMKRLEANDPEANRKKGEEKGEKGDFGSAFDYFSKAAQLGDAEAQYRLAVLYGRGQGVEKDRVKKMYHLEEAAIGGHPKARTLLGCDEFDDCNFERAVKHWIIAASQGDGLATKALVHAFKKGVVEKGDLASALRAHQAAVDATKSPQRDAAEEFYRNMPNMR